MRFVVLTFFAITLCAAILLCQEQPSASGKVPYGWSNVGGIELTPAKSVTCAEGKRCATVISAWSGAALDRTNKRLIIFGGGHGDYYGNEQYALSYGSPKPSFSIVYKATEPPNSTCANLTGPVEGHSSEEACTKGLPALRTPKGACYENPLATAPNSRHTYAGMTGIDALDNGHPGFLVVGGAFACASGSGDQSDAWLEDLTTGQWKHMSIPRPWSGSLGSVIAQYDSASKHVYLMSDNVFGAYDPERNTFKQLSDVGGGIYAFGAVNPNTGEFVLFEPHAGINKIWGFDLKSGKKRDLTSKAIGCRPLLESTQEEGPRPYASGIAFDPGDRSLVIWPNAGASVFVFKDGNCTEENFAKSGSPPSSTTPEGGQTGSSNGTYGRWQNVSPGLFLLVTDWNLPAKFLCRKQAGCKL